MPNKNIDWPSLDWERTNNELAEDIGCNPCYVSHMRNRLGSNTGSLDWSKVDWSKSDEQIRSETNRSRSQVAKMRRLWT